MSGWIELKLYTLDYIGCYIATVLIVFFIYFLFLKKFYISFYDPFFFTILGSAFAATVPFFMYRVDLLGNMEYIYWFAGTELAFILGLVIVGYQKQTIEKQNELKYEEDGKRIFYSYFIIYMCLRFLGYIKVGIPLIDYDSHVEAFQDGGVLVGLLPETISVPLVFMLVFNLYKKKSLLMILYGVLIGLTFILTGAKSSFLSFAYGVFFLILLINKCGLKRSNKIIKIGNIILFIAVFSVFFILYIRAGDNASLDEILISFGNRLEGYGDIYAYAFQPGVMEHLMKNYDFYELYIAPILGMLHIVPRDESAEAIGRLAVMSDTNIYMIEAPNGRMNIVNLMSFGIFGGVAVSFLLGGLILYITRIFYMKNKFSLYSYILWIFVYNTVVIIPTDPRLFIGLFMYGMFANLLILFFSYLLRMESKRNAEI